MIDIKLPFVESEAERRYHHHRMIISDFCTVVSVWLWGSYQHCSMPSFVQWNQGKRERACSASWELPRHERQLDSHVSVSLLHSLHLQKKKKKPTKSPSCRKDCSATHFSISSTRFTLFECLSLKKIVKKIKWWQTSSQSCEGRTFSWICLLSSSLWLPFLKSRRDDSEPMKYTGGDCARAGAHQSWQSSIKRQPFTVVFQLTELPN